MTDRATTNTAGLVSAETSRAAGVIISMEPVAVSVPQAAALIAVSRRWLDARIADGQLKVSRLGRRVVVTPQALRQLVADHAVNGGPQAS